MRLDRLILAREEVEGLTQGYEYNRSARPFLGLVSEAVRLLKEAEHEIERQNAEQGCEL